LKVPLNFIEEFAERLAVESLKYRQAASINLPSARRKVLKKIDGYLVKLDFCG